MLDPSKCLNFVFGGDACVASPFDRMTVRSVSAYPTPRRLRTRIRQPLVTCAVGIYGRIVWRNQLSHSEISLWELHRSFWRFLHSSAGPARRRVAGQAFRCRPNSASVRRLLCHLPKGVVEAFNLRAVLRSADFACHNPVVSSTA